MSNIVVAKWLTSRLRSDTTIRATVSTRVYKAPAMAHAAYPCIVMDLVGSETEHSVGSSVALQHYDYEVALVAQTEDDTTMQACAARIDELLADARGTYGTTPAHVMRCTKLGEINDALIEGSARYLRLGGRYRITYQGTT